MAATKLPEWEMKLSKIERSKHAETIIGWLAAAKWPGSSFAPAWSAMFATLVALDDPAVVDALHALAKDMPAFLGSKHRAWVAEQMVATADAIASKAKTKRGGDAGLLRPIAVKKPGASDDTMSIVQRVFDSPDDDDLRRVVADQLLERGEPWGEFIQLGFLIDQETATPEQKALAAKLAQKNATTFAGPLAKIAKADSREFEKGFLRRVLTNATMVARPAWEAATTSAYWATVQRLEVDMVSTPKWWTPALMTNPALRRLRQLHFNRYYEPLLSLEREGESAPWRLVTVTNTSEPWLRFLRAFVMALPASEQQRFEVAAIPERNAVLQSLADAR